MFTNYPIIRPIINRLYVTTPRKIDSFGSTISCFRKQRAIDRSIFHRGPTILLPIHFVTPFGIYPRVWKIRRMKNRGTGGGRSFLPIEFRVLTADRRSVAISSLPPFSLSFFFHRSYPWSNFFEKVEGQKKGGEGGGARRQPLSPSSGYLNL